MSVLGSHTLNFQAMADAHAHIPRPENQAKFKLRGSKKLLDDSVQDDEPLDEVQPRTKQNNPNQQKSNSNPSPHLLLLRLLWHIQQPQLWVERP